MEQIVAARGKSKILAFRRLKDEATEAGLKLALQVEHTLTYERGDDSTETKDGLVNAEGNLTVTLDLTAIASNDPLNKMLRDSVINGDKLEVWEIDLDDERTPANTFGALYMRGNLRSWPAPAPAGGLVEISTSMGIDGVPVEGPVTLSEEMIDQVQYAFRDLTIVVTP